MASVEFSSEQLLEQAQSNQSAIWHTALRRAREQEGSVDQWARYVGEEFAPSWDDMSEASAFDVARMAALNIATTADMRPVDLSGDSQRAELVIEGPDAEWLEQTGTRREDHDRANELIFRVIAERRGLTLDAQRDSAGLHLVFAKE